MSTISANNATDGVIPPVWLDAREAAAWRGFLEMRVVLMGRLGRSLQQHSGLSEAEYGVLVELSESAEGKLRYGELGERLGWEKSRVSSQVARMRRRGLVGREDCPADGRGAFAVILPEGREVIERAAASHVLEVRRWFVDALSSEQLDAMAQIADNIVRRLREHGVD